MKERKEPAEGGAKIPQKQACIIQCRLSIRLLSGRWQAWTMSDARTHTLQQTHIFYSASSFYVEYSWELAERQGEGWQVESAFKSKFHWLEYFLANLPDSTRGKCTFLLIIVDSSCSGLSESLTKCEEEAWAKASSSHKLTPSAAQTRWGLGWEKPCHSLSPLFNSLWNYESKVKRSFGARHGSMLTIPALGPGYKETPTQTTKNENQTNTKQNESRNSFRPEAPRLTFAFEMEKVN